MGVNNGRWPLLRLFVRIFQLGVVLFGWGAFGELEWSEWMYNKETNAIGKLKKIVCCQRWVVEWLLLVFGNNWKSELLAAGFFWLANDSFSNHLFLKICSCGSDYFYSLLCSVVCVFIKCSMWCSTSFCFSL